MPPRSRARRRGGRPAAAGGDRRRYRAARPRRGGRRALVACDRRQVVSAIANLLDNAVKYSEPGSAVDVETELGRQRGRLGEATRASGSRAAISSGSSSASTGSTRPAAATPAAPGSGSPSCATSRRRTAATSRSSRSRARGRRSGSCSATLDAPVRRRQSATTREPCARQTRGTRVMPDAPLILVVDDEQSYRDALRVALEREGFRVEVAADGAEGARAVRRDASRAGAARRDAAAGLGCRRVPRAAHALAGADHHGHRPQRRDRRRRRPRGRCRRLRHQAVPAAGAGGARARRAPPRPYRRRVGRRARRGARDRRGAPRRRSPRGAVRGERVPLPLKEFELLELLLANAGRCSRATC